MIILCVSLFGSQGTRYLVKHYFWVCLWGCLQKRFTSESVDQVQETPKPRWVGISRSIANPERTKRQTEGGFTLSNWVESSFLPCSWVPSLQTQRESHRHPPGSPAFRLRGSLTTALLVPSLQTQRESLHHSPGSPVYREQITGLLGLHSVRAEYLW